LLFQKAALVFEAFRLAAQGLDFGARLGSFAGFAFATGLDSGLPNLPKRVESFPDRGPFRVFQVRGSRCATSAM